MKEIIFESSLGTVRLRLLINYITTQPRVLSN